MTGCFNDGDKEENKVKIAVIGDSISDGCNPELSTSAEMYAKRYGYAQMLEGKKYEGIDTPAKTIYNIWNNAEYRNFSITGSKASEWNMDSSTSTKWHTWDKEFQKVLDFNPDIAVIYLGANDIFEYANYKLKKECLNRKFIYIDLSKQLSKNPMYFSKKGTFIPNFEGYEKISQIIVEKIQNN